ncbi:MAG TPA: SDR family oxidoreductase [Ramlibacter sp.]|nr:SDR family oxidoreductase [Ramlibacter sp.]
MKQLAVVTGGSAGIGKAICESLLAQDWEVLSLDRQPAQVRHERLHAIQVDLTDRQATAEAAADIARRFEVTAFVHNAGAMRPALLPDVQLEDLDALVDLHLASAILLTQALLPGMKQRRHGRILLMASRAVMGAQTRTSYSATKAGLIGMARTWALELAQDGITVNLVAPGPVRTDMFHEVIPAGSEREAKLAASIPVGRVGEPADVARAVAFFVHPDAGFVTGQVLYVCGGASLGSLSL